MPKTKDDDDLCEYEEKMNENMPNRNRDFLEDSVNMPLRSVPIVPLKMIEIIVLVVATGTVGHFLKEDHDLVKEGKFILDPYDLGAYGRYEFFLYTTSVGVIIAILSLVASITGLLEKQGGTLAMVVVHTIWTLQLLVSTALLAKTLTSLQKKLDRFGTFGMKKSVCDLLDDANHDYTCSQLIAGVVFGFIGTILFFVDTFVYTTTVAR